MPPSHHKSQTAGSVQDEGCAEKVVPRLLCVLAPLIVTGHALTCTSCVCLNEVTPTCMSSSVVQCPSSDVCATTYRKTTSQNGRVTYDIIRACAPKDKCYKVGGFSSYNVRMTMGIGCCSTDRCTPDLPQLTQDTSAYNNVHCSTCFSSQSTVCQTIGNMTCTGQETRCVAYSMSGSGADSVYRGCGTPSLCDIQHYTAILTGYTVEHSFTCGTYSVLSGDIAPGIILIGILSVILMNRSL